MEDRSVLAGIWPLFGLVVRTPRLELRYTDDVAGAAMAALTGDIHDPDMMPFETPWSRAPDGERERNTMAHLWQNRAAVGPETWVLDLVVVLDGEVVGNQSLRAVEFATSRTVDTGSWLHRPQQGRGVGQEMRQAVLHLAFAGLGAERATTCCFDDNPASRRVTEAVGYRSAGERVEDFDGRPRRLLDYMLDRADWLPRRRTDIALLGLDPCRGLLGAAPHRLPGATTGSGGGQAADVEGGALG